MTPQMRQRLIGMTRGIGTDRIAFLGTQHERAATLAGMWREQQELRRAFVMGRNAMAICLDCGLPEIMHGTEIPDVFLRLLGHSEPDKNPCPKTDN